MILVAKFVVVVLKMKVTKVMLMEYKFPRGGMKPVNASFYVEEILTDLNI